MMFQGDSGGFSETSFEESKGEETPAEEFSLDAYFEIDSEASPI